MYPHNADSGKMKYQVTLYNYKILFLIVTGTEMHSNSRPAYIFHHSNSSAQWAFQAALPVSMATGL